MPNVFAAAENETLSSDSDFDKYIDASIVGNDRILARKLLRLMPDSMRGDFLYYDGNRVLIGWNLGEPKIELGDPNLP